MAMMGKGLKEVARQEFAKKVQRVVVMGSTEKARTLVVTKKIDKKTATGIDVVGGIPLTTILEKAAEQRYETRTEFGAGGCIAKLYLMKRTNDGMSS